MKRTLAFIICLPLLFLCSCDVHIWPELPEEVSVHIKLNYDTEMTKWNHLYDGEKVVEQNFGPQYENIHTNGKIRYIVRAYPVSENQRSLQNYTREFIYTKDLVNGYNHDFIVRLPSGKYNIMVWSDLQEAGKETYYYNAGVFSDIHLSGEHIGNTDYKDAYRGTGEIEVISDVVEYVPEILEIQMQRPLAKFEFITNDVEEFIYKETTRIKSKVSADNNESTDGEPTITINIEDYKVVFYYVGFMPNSYSMFTDKPVDSSVGVMFESTLKRLSKNNASIGFDYVMVNGKKSAVTVQIAIFDSEGLQLSLTDPVEVPLQRSHHTVLKGMFLMSEASGGVSINPDFEDDHNIIIQ